MRRVLIYAALSVGSIIMIFPFLWMVSSSLKPPDEVLALPPYLMPKNPTLMNYSKILSGGQFPLFLLNSIIVVSVSTVVAIFISSLAGFIFAKYKFRLREFLFFIILVTTMIPFQTYMVPLYLLMRDFHLVDTLTGIMAPLFVTSFGIFFMRQNILALPDELIDAARIDGCSEFSIYWKIILPLSKAPLSALTIFVFMFGWKFFIWPLIMANTTETFVLEVGLAMFAQRSAMDYGTIMAGSTFSMLPIVMVFLILRRKFTRGITLTGLKG